MRAWLNIEDLRDGARRRLPRIFYDYIDGAAFSESTMRANTADYRAYNLVQKVLATAEEQDLTTEILGKTAKLPFMLGPIGYLGLYYRDGDVAAAQAASTASIPFCHSTFSIASLSEISEVIENQLCFQLYILDDVSICEELIDVAKGLNVGTIVVTVDTPVTSLRERDARNGFRELDRVTPALAAQMAMKPSWLLNLLCGGIPSARGFDHHPEFGRGALEQASNLSRRIKKTITWDDIIALRKRWEGRLVIKGILNPNDAQLAQQAGVDAIIVSNHGGRQLDGASSTISVLPQIRAAVGKDFELILDGGIRRGKDIIIALALGANAVSLGRAYVYGVAAGGNRGVSTAIDILRSELVVCLALMGVNSIAELKRRGPEVISSAGR